MSAHNFDHRTEFCTECGLARFRFVEQYGQPVDCTGGDHVPHLKALHLMDALILRPTLEALGLAAPETRH